MNVIHLSAECYPVAKVGGLGDVVGALPRYLCEAGVNASVVMPYYDRKFVKENSFSTVFTSTGILGNKTYQYTILKESTAKLGFELYLIHIPGLLDRKEVYCYPDEIEQFISFQISFVDWISKTEQKPDIIHCHDHHSGLIPFLITHSIPYRNLSAIPTVCTIHNGQYQGWFGWDKISFLPDFDLSKAGLLDWSNCINSLATSVKCCWKFTTVSPSYLEELSYNSNGLEKLFQMEKSKGLGIINGIDTEVWDPEKDSMISKNYSAEAIEQGKKENKKLLCKEFDLSIGKPLIVFIGRLVGEKGADLLAESVSTCIDRFDGKLNFLILGSGDASIEKELLALSKKYKKNYGVYIGYDEELSHRIYAGADFLIMPSRVEPCGLNQLYAMRYGTVPVVHKTGGLKDTVIDITEQNGYGLSFETLNVEGISNTIGRAMDLYKDTLKLKKIKKEIMMLDFSWHRSAMEYIELYKRLITT